MEVLRVNLVVVVRVILGLLQLVEAVAGVVNVVGQGREPRLLVHVLEVLVDGDDLGGLLLCLPVRGLRGRGRRRLPRGHVHHGVHVVVVRAAAHSRYYQLTRDTCLYSRAGEAVHHVRPVADVVQAGGLERGEGGHPGLYRALEMFTVITVSAMLPSSRFSNIHLSEDIHLKS